MAIIAWLRWCRAGAPGWLGGWPPGWMETWLAPTAFAWKGATIDDVSYPLALAIEKAKWTKKHRHGCMLDREKCFDRFGRWILDLEKVSGCPSGIAEMRSRLYSQAQRGIRINTSMEEDPRSSKCLCCSYQVATIAGIRNTRQNKQ